MKLRTGLYRGACALLLAAASCGGGTDKMSTPATTRMDLSVSPLDTTVDLPVTFTVTAANDQTVIKSVAIDYNGDGVWDETRDFHQSSVTAAFTHTYDAAGDVSVVAEVRTSDDAATSKGMVLVVAAKPPKIPVTYTMYGYSTEGGGCYAYGTPAECDDCAELLGTLSSQGVTKSLGNFQSGALVSVDQGFNQWPVDPERHEYACQFVMQLFSGPPGNVVPIGSGTCATDSTIFPPLVNCRISASGIVKVK